MAAVPPITMERGSAASRERGRAEVKYQCTLETCTTQGEREGKRRKEDKGEGEG